MTYHQSSTEMKINLLFVLVLYRLGLKKYIDIRGFFSSQNDIIFMVTYYIKWVKTSWTDVRQYNIFAQSSIDIKQ